VHDDKLKIIIAIRHVLRKLIIVFPL